MEKEPIKKEELFKNPYDINSENEGEKKYIRDTQENRYVKKTNLKEIEKAKEETTETLTPEQIKTAKEKGYNVGENGLFYPRTKK